LRECRAKRGGEEREAYLYEEERVEHVRKPDAGWK
jgi:hypothetical protein